MHGTTYSKYQKSQKGKATRKRYNTSKGKITNEKYRISPKGRLVRLQSGSKRRAIKKLAFVEDVSLDILRKQQRGHCGICHRWVKCEDDSLDHIWPLIHGGMHSYTNCQMTHLKCNLEKNGQITPAVYDQ